MLRCTIIIIYGVTDGFCRTTRDHLKLVVARSEKVVCVYVIMDIYRRASVCVYFYVMCTRRMISLRRTTPAFDKITIKLCILLTTTTTTTLHYILTV